MEEIVSSIELPSTAEPLTTTSSANPLVDQVAQKVLLADKGEIALRIESFQKESPPAFVWMQICSYLNPDTIPVSYLERHLPDEEQRGPVTLALTNCGLMLLDEETFSTNELIQRILQKMDPTGAALNKACTLLSEIELDYNDPDVKILNVKSTIWASHAELLLRRADEIQPASLGPLLLQMGTHERVVLKNHEEALEHSVQALEILKRVHGEEHPKVTDALKGVGNALFAMGQHEEALEHFEHSLRITEKIHGEEHLKVADALYSVGNTLRVMGQHEKALEHFEHSLRITEKMHGEEHTKVADRLINVGVTLHSLRKYDEALKCFQRALEIRKAHLGIEHPDVARILSNIGLCYRPLKQHAEALKYCERALVIMKKTHSEKHPDVAQCLNNTMSVLGLMHRYDEAIAHAERALKIWKQIHGEEHADVAAVLYFIGRMHNGLECYETAAKYCRQAVDIGEKVLPPDSPTLERYRLTLKVIEYDLPPPLKQPAPPSDKKGKDEKCSVM